MDIVGQVTDTFFTVTFFIELCGMCALCVFLRTETFPNPTEPRSSVENVSCGQGGSLTAPPHCLERAQLLFLVGQDTRGPEGALAVAK